MNWLSKDRILSDQNLPSSAEDMERVCILLQMYVLVYCEKRSE